MSLGVSPMPRNVVSLLGKVIALVTKLATDFPAALPFARMILEAAFSSGDPVRAMQRAAAAAGAKAAAIKAANAALKAKKR